MTWDPKRGRKDRESSDEREQFILYLRHLYSIYRDRGRYSGYSGYALWTALFIIIAANLDNYAMIVRLDQLREHFFFLVSLLTLALFSSVCLVAIHSRGSMNALDRRMAFLEDRTNKWREASVLIIVIGMPLIFLTLAKQSYQSSAPGLLVFWGALIILVVFAIGALYRLGDDILFTLRTGLPAPNVAKHQPASKGTRIATSILGLLFLCLASVSSVVLLSEVGEILLNMSPKVISGAGSIVLMIIIGVLLLSINAEAYKGRYIERLERDIVIHNLSLTEAKRQLQEQVLGWQVGDWLAERVGHVKSQYHFIEQYKRELKEIENAYSSDQLEAKVALEKVRKWTSDFKKQYTDVRLKNFHLLKWLKKAIYNDALISDKEMERAVSRALSEYGNLQLRLEERFDVLFEQKKWLEARLNIKIEKDADQQKKAVTLS